eukprot:scaffold51060_cov65-Cyclotella_meneghiniana.AAC.5
MDETKVNQSSKRGSSSPSSASRQAKRNKQLNNETHLPAEMWAAVMGYLDFSSVLSMTATSRTMNDATPLVSELHITKSCQLHGSVGRRFKEVNCVYIYSLTQIRDLEEDRDPDDEDEIDAVIDFETSVRAVPFMYTFANLKRVYFGGINVVSELYKVVPFHDVMIDAEANEQHFSRLTDSISAGFRCGILPPTLEVSGLLCTRMWQSYNREDEDDPCEVCERACQSFPIKTVAAFECDEGHNDQQPQNCICLEVDEWIHLIESRPEGQGFTSSKAPILELLGQCERICLATKHEKSLWLIQFSDRTETKLDRILGKTSLNKSELNRHEVDEDVFGSPSRRLEIAKEFLLQMNPSAVTKCVSLLESLVSQENPPIQDIIDSGAVSVLLESINESASVRSLRTLALMLKPKEEHQVASILDQGILKHFYEFLIARQWNELNVVYIICDALKYIASTSVSTRQKLINCDNILYTLSKFISDVRESRPACIGTLKSIFCNKDMPLINLNSLEIAEPTLANICCSMDLSLVDFVVSVLDTQIGRQQLSGEQSMSSYSSFARAILSLMSSPSTELHALKIMSQLSELDYFGSVATLTHLSLIPILYKYLESESNETARQACSSMGYLLRHSSRDILLSNDEQLFSTIIVKYICALARLSNDGGHLITIHQKLLSYLQKQITSAGARERLINLQDELNEMSFERLSSLLECDESTTEVEAELKTFLAKRTSIAIEDQIRRCIECWAKELGCEARDIMTDDQVKAAAVQMPLTAEELETRGFMENEDDGYIYRSRKKYGESMLELMKDYHYARNWREYHHCGIFVILHHCTSQINIPGD